MTTHVVSPAQWPSFHSPHTSAARAVAKFLCALRAREKKRLGDAPRPFTSRFFIKPHPEPHEPWPWRSSFWEPRASLATVLARSDSPSIHHLESASRRW